MVGEVGGPGPGGAEKECSAWPCDPAQGTLYSQHAQGPQPVEGVDGDAAQPVVAQDPAEKDMEPCQSSRLSCSQVHCPPGAVPARVLSSPLKCTDKSSLTTRAP